MTATGLEPEDEIELLTPTVRRSVRRALFWILGVVIVLGVGFVIMVLERAGQGPTDVLDPEAATPQGARAVVEVLRGQGVEVMLSSSLDATAAAIGPDSNATILLNDKDAVLEPEQLERLLTLAPRLIVLNPGFTELETLAPDVANAGSLVLAVTTLGAECADETATRAETLRGEGEGYRIIDGASGAVGCFPGDVAEVYGLVETVTGDTRVAVLGPTGILRNDTITEGGNAALSLGLLGEAPLLVWYEPGVDDLRAADRVPTIAELSGPWVTPLALLVVVVVVGAAFWQGRRFGPLVIERLPVEVRARETLEGRARLYARGDARAHALDALRIGTIGRLADRIGLSRSASADELVAALAALTGRDRGALDRLLVHGVPGSDAELLAYSDELRLLEDEVAEDVRP